MHRSNAFLLAHVKALGFLLAFKELADCVLLSSLCDGSNLRISMFKYASTLHNKGKQGTDRQIF